MTDRDTTPRSPRIAFVGDVHGCVQQCLAALLDLHEETPLDAIIQVGDLGAWPDVATMYERDPPSKWFAEDNSRTLDWFDLLQESSPRARVYEEIRERLAQPILFLRGNHDDPNWLSRGAMDPFDLFHFVTDGTVLEIRGMRLGFLGGIEVDPAWPEEMRRYSAPHALDDQAIGNLADEPFDVLVTHDGPYGIASNWRGDVQGSGILTEFVRAKRPRWHIAGHYHHLIGPRAEGPSTYVGLGILVRRLRSRWARDEVDPSGCVQATSIAVLDFATGEFTFPSAGRMRQYDKDFDIAALAG